MPRHRPTVRRPTTRLECVQLVFILPAFALGLHCFAPRKPARPGASETRPIPAGSVLPCSWVMGRSLQPKLGGGSSGASVSLPSSSPSLESTVSSRMARSAVLLWMVAKSKLGWRDRIVASRAWHLASIRSRFLPRWSVPWSSGPGCENTDTCESGVSSRGGLHIHNACWCAHRSDRGCRRNTSKESESLSDSCGQDRLTLPLRF